MPFIYKNMISVHLGKNKVPAAENICIYYVYLRSNKTIYVSSPPWASPYLPRSQINYDCRKQFKTEINKYTLLKERDNGPNTYNYSLYIDIVEDLHTLFVLSATQPN